MDDEGSYPSAQRLNNGSVPHANATAPAMSVLIENNENGTPHENKNVRKIKTRKYVQVGPHKLRYFQA